VGGARPPPLITFTLTTKVGVYAPAEWADTLTLFHLYQYVYSVSVTVNSRRETNNSSQMQCMEYISGGGMRQSLFSGS
jgi:hypothetical protein